VDNDEGERTNHHDR